MRNGQDITSTKHPLAEQLLDCDSVKSATAVLHEKARTYSEFKAGHKVMTLVKNVVSVLCYFLLAPTSA
jgi:hypothetical protein